MRNLEKPAARRDFDTAMLTVQSYGCASPAELAPLATVFRGPYNVNKMHNKLRRQPLTAPWVKPSISRFDAMKNRISKGSTAIAAPTINAPHSVLLGAWMLRSASGTV